MTFVIKPDWQPMETAPKDGSTIRLAIQHVNFETGEIVYCHVDAFWGKMTGYPDRGNVWVAINEPVNGFYHDDKFVRQVSRYNDHGQERTLYCYHGSRIVGWTRPWDIAVDYPTSPAPTFAEKVYDHRK